MPHASCCIKQPITVPPDNVHVWQVKYADRKDNVLHLISNQSWRAEKPNMIIFCCTNSQSHIKC